MAVEPDYTIPEKDQRGLPADLLQAIAAPGGGRIALIVGAGCSVEPPTSLPASGIWSKELHRRLVADGVLKSGDCSDPNDLSCVADAVFAKTNSQQAMIDRIRDLYNLQVATPNEGHLIAAAMLCEKAISSIVTLNFDLAFTLALGQIGAKDFVGIIESPSHLPRQRTVNLFYLHRNANEPDPDRWVLRTMALKTEWQNHWEAIIAGKVLTTPVVIFAGLGTPVAVLIESVKLLRNALPGTTRFYQADPANHSDSKFFEALAIESCDYVQMGWCQFMEELSSRLVQEQIVQLKQAIDEKIRTDGLENENVASILARLENLGLVKFGIVRASWLLYDKPYYPIESNTFGLIADLLLAISRVARISNAVPFIIDNGVVEFRRDGRVVAAHLIASGCGHRSCNAIESALESRRSRYKSCMTQPNGAIIGGTSDFGSALPTPPSDIVRGDIMEKDIIMGPLALPYFHISELRRNPELIHEAVP